MVVKHCPNCRRTLAVACKTCPRCSYIFQAKKNLTSKSSENEVLKHEVESEKAKSSSLIVSPPAKKRGRPKGSKDKQKRLPKGHKQFKLVRNIDFSRDTEWTMGNATTALLMDASSQEDKDSKMGRKRGRPRGSKNKSTHCPMFYAEDLDEFDSDEREDSCCQSEENFTIPSDKKEKFSLILDDINSRIAGQSFVV